ncbi:hypothetical protein QBC44DRAFT_328304 [Cladorrhinum sp. PSN332]|nr:hypothetical protein QBC44DRAFT_328304 [Cladorrhinum sp. PSN332]
MATKVDDIQRILQQPPEYLQAQVPATIIPGIDLTPANRASGLGDNTLAAVEAYAPEPFDPYKHLSDFLSLLKHADYHFDRSDVGQMLRDFVNQPDYSTHKHSFWVNVMNSIPKPKQEDTKFWNGLFSAIPVSADEMGNDDNFWKAIAGSLPRLTDDSAGWEAWAALIAGLKWNLGGMLLYPSLWARLYDSIDAACECNVRMWTELVSQVPYYTRASIGLKSAVQKAGDWGPGFERVWNQAMIYSHV